ncbi:hypothetical protein DIPPA_20296 [Diplonema papillatum]|nr:hypothetical protein DIPPA_20296 [Diplonema papillatum]
MGSAASRSQSAIVNCSDEVESAPPRTGVTRQDRSVVLYGEIWTPSDAYQVLEWMDAGIVEELTLASCDLADQDALEVLRAPSAANLVHVNLMGNASITDATGLRLVELLAPRGGLQLVSLSRTGVTDTTVVAFARGLPDSCLRRLWLSGLPGVGAAAVTELCAALPLAPDVEVVSSHCGHPGYVADMLRHAQETGRHNRRKRAIAFRRWLAAALCSIAGKHAAAGNEPLARERYKEASRYDPSSGPAADALRRQDRQLLARRRNSRHAVILALLTQRNARVSIASVV